jgi:hypothetical protein
MKLDGRKLTVKPRLRVPEMKGTAAAPYEKAFPATVVGWEGRAIPVTFSDVARFAPSVVE